LKLNYHSVSLFNLLLTNFYNDLATVLEKYSQTIGGFLALHKNEINFHMDLELKLKQQALQQNAEQTEELKRDDKKTPNEKMDYIQEYFTDNPEKLYGKTVHSHPNEEDYTVFTFANKGDAYYLIYNTKDGFLYWTNKTTQTTKKRVFASLILQNSNDDLHNLHNLLNLSYFNILSSQQEHETHLIPPDVIGELYYTTRINKRLANELRKYTQVSQGGGGKKTTYKLNGEKVVLLHKNKKVQRSIYVKGNGKTKYCIIDKEYVLLSKVKNKIQ
jgi:hypothetical protein